MVPSMKISLATVAVCQWWKKTKRRSLLPMLPGTGVASVGTLFYSLIMGILAAQEIARFGSTSKADDFLRNAL